MDVKIKSKSTLSKILDGLRKKGKRIVFTNGCFDIIHLGHVEYLAKARALGDILVVGLNSDSSVKAIKGSGRPINRQAARARVLAAFYFVDFVTIFGEPTPEKLIRMLKPDILVKGGDWKAKRIAGSDFVKSLGGRVATIPFVKGYSTTALLKKAASSG